MRKQAEYELYKRLKLLGEGAFGKAYLVECLQDKSLWVSKYMDLAAMTNQEKDETLREAKILEFLSHPNIVKFREVYKTKKGRLCIVMEYADGGDLSQKIKEAKGKYLPEAQILDWFTQICLAIKHVHDRKIIHRDLKGQNIFLNKEGQVKLGDFGIARILKITLEKAKTMVGTPYYISPEIIEGKPYSVMTDIWSLGVILYELCALQPPFNGDSLHVLAINIVKGQYKPIPANYSKDLKQLVQQMLQVDYRRRPTIQEILKMPVITNRIKSFLSETIQKQEFSHTVFHNKMFEVKGNLNQVNLILNEQPCPPQFLEQNAKNLQEFPEVIKKPSLQDCDIIRPPQIMKQQQQPLSRQSDLQKDAPKIQQQEYQYKKQDIQKQIDVPKKIDPIIKNSPLIQKKDISKDIPQQKEVIKQSPKQQYPIRPKSDQEKQQRSEPCRFDGKVQQKHSNSEQALIPDQKKQQFISPKNKQKLDQPRPPTAPKEQPKLQVAQQRPQSSRPLVSDQKIVQKVNIEQKRRISVDKAPVIQPQQQKQQQLEQQQLEQQRQEEKNRQLKLKQQQEQQEQEKKQKEYQIQQQLLEKQRQLEKQQQLDKQKQQQQQQLEKQKGIEEKQRNIENQLISKMDINRNDQQKQNLQKQPYQKSSQIDNKQFESKQQIKSKADQLQKIEKNAKDFDLMFKELESLINNVHNAIEKFPNQGGKENYFDQNLIQTILIEDREDDEAEPIDQDYKKKKYMVKQISKQEEQCLDILNKQDQNFFSLGIKLENALGQEKMNKAKNIIKQTLEKMNLEKMELQYGPNYEQLLPFLTLEERKKYTQLLFTYILCE
ncbi:unnamed protein product [Paramecium pentaurelia]|uniref:non-specific serine/threonine protein kinase n=1 Tax=Paramecium pentaurelia TaxID=43138 RepID=A0A8S1Y1F9_9CILI|nr:unnamed protein product [Paramecium pentaurelia]